MEQGPHNTPKLPVPVFQLTTVHHALARAANSPRRRGANPMGTHTFRIPDEIKEKTRAKCEQHGADLDSFLRACCLGLLGDYRIPVEKEAVAESNSIG